MYEEQLIYSYDLHKKEAKRILNKITCRYYQQLQRTRSEGFQIVEDLKEQLRKNYRRTQTEKMSKRIRLKRMSEHYQKCILQENDLSNNQNSPRLNSRLITKQMTLVKNQIENKIGRTSKKKSSILEQIEMDQLLLEVANSLKDSQQSIESEQKSEDQSKQNSRVEESQKNGGQQTEEQKQMEEILTHYKENKTFLPMLELYVEERHFLKTMSKQQEKIHSIITQMLLLAIARRKNNKFFDSLDILIEINSFFPQNNHQMELLKSVWFQLIATVFMEIKQEDKKKQNKWKTDALRSPFKAVAQMRRQKTIIIRSLASKRNFFDKVTVQLKKMDLIHETSYSKECKHFKNVIKQSQQGKIVVSKINQNCLLSYPEPKFLFPDIQNVVNYGMVFLNRDKETHLFPNHFPLSLSRIIREEDYMEMLCKINSVLVPEAKCFSFAKSLNLNFEYIVLIAFFLLLGTVLITLLIKKIVTNIVTYIVIFFIFILLTIVCIKMQNTSQFSFGNETFQIKKILERWQDQYEGNMKVIVSDFNDLMIISYPKEVQSESIISEQDDDNEDKTSLPEKLKTLKCSSNSKFLEEIKQILKQNESSHFGKETQRNNQEQSEDSLGEDSRLKSESSDSVIDDGERWNLPKKKASLFVFEFQGDGQNFQQKS